MRSSNGATDALRELWLTTCVTLRYSQGYRGVAIGKGKTEAKTEIEKLALDEMTAEEALVEAARMYVCTRLPLLTAR